MYNEEQNREFLDLFESVRGDLSRFCRALAKDPDDAKDLVSETILRTYENFEKITDKSKFKGYIFTIASRLQKRKLWRGRIFSIFETEKMENIPYRGANAETNLDVEILYKALQKLPASQAEAIVLFEISGFSLNEITEIQGGTLSGVKTRLKRGREKLASILNKNDVNIYFEKKFELREIENVPLSVER